LPEIIEKLFLTSVRQINSSTVGPRKNGLPKRKESSFGLKPPPAPVSAGTFDVIADRGLSSRVYEKCASFSFVADTVEKRLMLRLFIFDGPSMPLAELP